MLQSMGSQRVRRDLVTERQPPPPYIQALERILSSQDSFLACQVWGRLGTCPLSSLPCLPGSLLFTTHRRQLPHLASHHLLLDAGRGRVPCRNDPPKPAARVSLSFPFLCPHWQAQESCPMQQARCRVDN